MTFLDVLGVIVLIGIGYALWGRTRPSPRVGRTQRTVCQVRLEDLEPGLRGTLDQADP